MYVWRMGYRCTVSDRDGRVQRSAVSSDGLKKTTADNSRRTGTGTSGGGGCVQGGKLCELNKQGDGSMASSHHATHVFIVSGM